MTWFTEDASESRRARICSTNSVEFTVRSLGKLSLRRTLGNLNRPTHRGLLNWHVSCFIDLILFPSIDRANKSPRCASPGTLLTKHVFVSTYPIREPQNPGIIPPLPNASDDKVVYQHHPVDEIIRVCLKIAVPSLEVKILGVCSSQWCPCLFYSRVVHKSDDPLE